MSSVRVKEIKQEGERRLSVTWTDGRHDVFDAVRLRQECPCAKCIDEMTNERMLNPSDVPDHVRPTVIRSVGHYAMSIHFNDGHSTGIYTFPLLRQLAKDGGSRPIRH